MQITPQPKAGDHVIVKGEISVYPPQGTYKIVVRELYYVGLGALLLKYEELKAKLHHLGWFANERKKSLPKFPKTIGIVTSPTGAVIQDMLNILNKRFPGFQLLINPVRVQGAGAADEIAAAIRFFNTQNNVDVIIVARGGGSLEDLWCFNEEIVAAAIYASQIPIISAVGHETDFSLSDFVADVRAPTPTAAAQLVVPEKALLFDYLVQSKRRMQQALRQIIRHHAQRLQGLKRHPVFFSSSALLGSSIQQLDDVVQRLDHACQLYLNQKRILLTAYTHQLKGLSPTAQLEAIRQRLKAMSKNLNAAIAQKINHLQNQKTRVIEHLESRQKSQFQFWRQCFDDILLRKNLQQSWFQYYQTKDKQLQYIKEGLHSVDPRTLLKKGYSILFSEKDHSLIISTKDLVEHQSIKAYLGDGTALLSVQKIEIKDGGH